MAGITDIFDSLLSRPGYSSSSDDGAGISTRPTAVRVVTVVFAIALTLFGLTVTGAVNWAWAQDLVLRLNYAFTEDHGYIALLASPLLMIAGSFLRGL